MIAFIRCNPAILFDRLGMHLRLPSIVTGVLIYICGLADYWRRYSELLSTTFYQALGKASISESFKNNNRQQTVLFYKLIF